ncbi:MAG: PEP-CTERM sorting domain-containing protein [Gemmatirosa sp.]
MRALRSFLQLTIVGLLAAPAAQAQTDAITASFAGNQTFTGTLSQEFTVYGGPIRITRLGAFDGDGNGFLNAITVRLYDAQQAEAVPGASLTFSGSVGTRVGSFAFVDLATPIELPVGFVGRIAAFGYGTASEQYYNAFYNGGQLGPRVGMSGESRLSFGRVYHADGDAFPGTVSGDGAGGWYGAASFTFEPAVATTTAPEPGTWALLGTGLLAIGGLATRRVTRRVTRRGA